MKYLILLFSFFFSFQEIRYTKEREWVVNSYLDLKDKKILPYSFFDGQVEYRIHINDLWIYFQDQNFIRVKTPKGIFDLRTQGFFMMKKYYYFQFNEFQNDISTGKEGLLKLYHKKGAVNRIHLEYRGGGGYQFFLEK
jgi:hypothetical protein